MKFTEALETFIDIKNECEAPCETGLSRKEREETRQNLQAEFDEAVRVLDLFILPIVNGKHVLIDLAERVANLNKDCGEIGAGMLHQLVDQANYALEQTKGEL